MKNAYLKNIAGMSATMLLASIAGAQATINEVEPNETKANATLADNGGVGLVAGDMLSGTTTGTSTTAGAATSVDTFRVKMAAAPLAIYRHELAITGTAWAATIRGLSQTGTAAAGGTIGTGDNTLATASAVGGNDLVAWYGFGKGEELYYRVTGATGTTGPYTATLSTSTVTPIDLVGTIIEGSITIRPPASNTSDLDWWLYDANLDPIPGAGRDGGPSGMVGHLTLNLTPGTYYVAWSRFNGANNLASGIGETFFGTVTDFPHLFVSGASTTTVPQGIEVVSGAGTVTGTAPTITQFGQVIWYRMEVLPATTPTNPSGVGSVSPASVLAGRNSLYTVTVTPGTNPASTGLAVTANLSGIGGSATQTLFDDGSNGDATPGDNIFSYLITAPNTDGTFALPFTVSDAESRTGNGSVNLTISTVMDLGTLANGPTTVPTQSVTTAQARWYKFTLPVDVSAANANWVDIVSSATLSGGTFTNDTIMAVYNADGTVRASDDDDGPNSLSALSFGQTTPTRTNGNGAAHNGRDGALPAGEYYLVISGYNCTYSPNFVINPTSNSSGSVGGSIDFGPSTTNPSVAGGTASGLAGGTALLTATVTPGLVPTSTGLAVNADLSTLGGSATNAMYDDGTNGDVTIGDNVFSLTVSIPGAQAAGAYAVPMVVTDAESRSGNGSGTINVDEAGQTLATARNVDGVGAVTSISGIATSGDVDLYRIFICDPASFNASTVGGSTLDTQLFLFNADGTGVVMNDDDATGTAQSAITNELTSSLAPGAYYLAISVYNIDPRDAANTLIFPNSAAVACNGGVFRCQMAPTSATAVLDNWTTGATSNGNYTITLAGVSGEPCALPCGTADFDGDGDIGTDADIEAFFACLAGNCCATCYAGGADFDADGDIGTDADIESFFRVLAGGPC